MTVCGPWPKSVVKVTLAGAPAPPALGAMVPVGAGEGAEGAVRRAGGRGVAEAQAHRAAVGAADVVRHLHAERPVVGRVPGEGEVHRVLPPERVVELRLGADRPRGRGAVRGQVGGELHAAGRDRVEHLLVEADRLQGGAVRVARGVGRPALEVVAGAVHEKAVLVQAEIAGAGKELPLVEARQAVRRRAGRRGDAEEALAADRHRQRRLRLLDRALQRVGVVRPGHHRARRMHRAVRLREVGHEIGVHPLEADGLAVGDVVRDVAEGAALGGKAADRGGEGAEQGHGGGTPA